jgi:hypothetical protein
LSFYDEAARAERHVHELFPKRSCPFAIDTRARLGDGGFGLSTADLTGAGTLPSDTDNPWPLNMVPFGVAIDGVILDPSGPWFDGGPADPNNPFDRRCSGWEYDPIFSTVAALVGVSAEVRGHVQPGPGAVRGSPGLFHYHGAPRVMLANLRRALTALELREALVVGYSADGFAILDAVVPAEATASGRRLHLFSGYVLRQGARAPAPHTNPALVPPDHYDGTFVQDWEFAPDRKRALIESALRSAGEYLGLRADDLRAGRAEYALLDARNGLVTDAVRLRDAPSRAYVYVLTPDWPEIPRWFAREPSASFRAIMPLDSPAMGPPGRRQLYDHCPSDLANVHQWDARPPF